ncbi:MAG: SAM-dependent methyltransferase [Deltaproteobacteria bacterium]|nr:SAM-dependent methyltransferase [Deltaproteobacteria bacterium]
MLTEASIVLELKDRIEQRGRITFEEFMDTALYHPEYGYYTSKKARIGKEGDYYTNADVHRAFGVCIMRQIEEMKAILNHSPLNVVEAGAGKGLLCADILLSAKDKSPALFREIRYFIVEKSPDFIVRQKRHIEELGLMDKVSWVPEIKEGLCPSLSLRDLYPDGWRVEGEGGIGIVLSNELIDAFPVHKIRYSNTRWQEIYVSLKDGKLVETEDDPSDQRLADFLSSAFRNPQSAIDDGYTTEVNLKAIDWVKGVGNSLQKGFVITIDYGYPRKELYLAERNRGTLMCYYKHQSSEDPFKNIGGQDMTAHVDFTSLAEAGREAGLEVSGFTDQSYFLMGCGIEEEFQQLEAINAENISAIKNNITLKKLLIPGGMGSTFKVLIQHKGIEKPQLRGFSFKDMANRLRG